MIARTFHRAAGSHGINSWKTLCPPSTETRCNPSGRRPTRPRFRYITSIVTSIKPHRNRLRLTPLPAPAPSPAPLQPKPAPPPPTLEVWSSPAGADIYLDGNYIGRTPYSAAVPPGEHTVILRKKDFGSYERKVQVQTGKLRVGGYLEQRAITLQ